MALLFKKQLLELSVIDHIKSEQGRSGLAEHTRRNLRNIGKMYNAWLKLNKQQLSEKSLKCFLQNLQLKQSSATWNLSRQNLKKLLKHQPGIGDNYLKRVMIDEIFTDIKNLRQDKKVVDYLQYSQVLQLILGSDVKTALIIEFLFKTGCRISEMINIRPLDVNVDRQVRISVIGKGSKQRTVFIDHELYERISKQFKGVYYLFENSKHHKLDRSNLFRKIKAAGQEVLHRAIHPHILRHSTANYLLKDCGKSPKFVSEYLGHSDTAVTLEMYIHEQPGEEVVDLFSYRKRERKVG
jgi:integrase